MRRRIQGDEHMMLIMTWINRSALPSPKVRWIHWAPKSLSWLVFPKRNSHAPSCNGTKFAHSTPQGTDECHVYLIWLFVCLFFSSYSKRKKVVVLEVNWRPSLRCQRTVLCRPERKPAWIHGDRIGERLVDYCAVLACSRTEPPMSHL